MAKYLEQGAAPRFVTAGKKRRYVHSSTSQAASGMELILLSRRMLELETGARQLVLLPLVSMLFTACPLLP